MTFAPDRLGFPLPFHAESVAAQKDLDLFLSFGILITMKITKEIVDAIAPEHGRTSCNDNDLANRFGGWSDRYNEKTGKKVIHYPRCNRCYLLDHVGCDTDSLEFKITVILEWKEN
jgi:hypothetical protein